jgi:hypothetical protein
MKIQLIGGNPYQLALEGEKGKSEREGKIEVVLIGWHHITGKRNFVLRHKLNEGA